VKNEKLPLKNIIKRIIRKIEDKEGGSETDFPALWEKVAGKDASGHTKPVSLTKGRLVVNVSDSSRLYTLSLKKKELIEGLNKELKKKIKEIRFKIGEIWEESQKSKVKSQK
jgi:predicted nucleic acid-binding Zn ribbon protein